MPEQDATGRDGSGPDIDIQAEETAKAGMGEKVRGGDG